MAYKGRYQPQNPEKIIGDPHEIVWRSLWERGVMRWLDANPDVVAWGSEVVVVNYICRTDNKPHRYFMDFVVVFRNNVKLLIEVKPNHQTKPPSSKNKNTLLREGLTYAKNISKWEAARHYANENGYSFQIWDEHLLDKIGIKTSMYKKPGSRR